MAFFQPAGNLHRENNFLCLHAMGDKMGALSEFHTNDNEV